MFKFIIIKFNQIKKVPIMPENPCPNSPPKPTLAFDTTPEHTPTRLRLHTPSEPPALNSAQSSPGTPLHNVEYNQDQQDQSALRAVQRLRQRDPVQRTSFSANDQDDATVPHNAVANTYGAPWSMELSNDGMAADDDAMVPYDDAVVPNDDMNHDNQHPARYTP